MKAWETLSTPPSHPPPLPHSLGRITQTGLAELLADPTAGPFTVFAPVDASLESIPGRMAIAADTEALPGLVQFHVAVGEAASPGGGGGETGGGGGTGAGFRGDFHGAEGEGEGVRGDASDLGTGARLFTPSLANATEEERSALSGERFASGVPLRTMLGDGTATLSVQIAAADRGGGGDASDDADGARILVFVGPGPQRNPRGLGSAGGVSGGVEGLGDLFLGAFAAEVVLPDLNAVNGVVHGISGVVTYPGYTRPAALVGVEEGS